ncbi:Transcription factor 7-like 1-A HMG box transcription factor 3-A [Larimichthys crocea]|uniref:Transcription factor 7-like 1-A HMG box transcription factor 3-A n=1 Tax=Larimichthys crocea TaxID=215358 RepID=A0A6G0HLE8_LARCR|nr:Transcription factor 7-like 1-A HMG box transcription factor 3-A [Larimichthys crocea]
MEDQIMLEREIRQKFERIMAEVEWGKVLSTLNDMLGDTLTPAQTVQPVPQYSEAGASSQEQYNNPPVVRLPKGLEHNLRCGGKLNDQLPPEVLAPPSYAPPARPTYTFKRREVKQEDDQQYIRKPPNAFMLFLKEQRPNFEAEVRIRGSAAVNATLGQRWKSLTVEEKDKYYKQAQKEKELHAQQHPEWTNKNNYGKKKKRVRCQRNASTAEASEFRPEDKRLIMAPHTLAGAMNIPHLQTGVIGARPQHRPAAATILDSSGCPSTSVVPSTDV